MLDYLTSYYGGFIVVAGSFALLMLPVDFIRSWRSL